MPTPRDKLIADWMVRLAAAEAIDFTSPSRPAWLARLQIRLYRFLLSLYGDSDWTTSPPGQITQSTHETSSDSVVGDVPDARSVCSKPVKTAGRIQAVLKTVANAQDHALQPGPLVAGLSADCVVVAASQSSNIHPGRLVRLFEQAGIACQARACGQDVVVEVTAGNLPDALLVIELNREYLRMQWRPPEPEPRASRYRAPAGWPALCILLLVPQFGLLAIAALSFALAFRSRNEPFVYEQYVLPVWGAAALAAFVCFLPVCATILLDGWRARRDAEQAIPPGREPF